VKGPQHFSIGLLSAGAGLWAAHLLGVDVGVLAVGLGAVVAGIGALAPDIDHPRSLISNKIPGRAIGVALTMALPLVVVAGAVWYFAGRRAGTSLLGTFSPMLQWALVVVVAALTLGMGSLVASKTLGHRGPIHSVAVGALASAGIGAGCASLGVPILYAMAFGWGWLTHLAADMTTRDGVPSALWPIVGSGSIIELLLGGERRSRAGLVLRAVVLVLLALLVLGGGRWLLAISAAAK
jgi:hypothetical protein